MDFLYFIGVLILFVMVFDLRGRMQKLEKTLSQHPSPQATQRAVPEPVLVPEPETVAAPSEVPATAAPQTAPQTAWSFDVVQWFKEEWLLKLGALLLLIGFGWLATYAFLNNWIGPMGRIVLGVVAGVAILLLGWWRIRSFVHQGGVFLVLGSTVILLTLFAARQIYGFFTPPSVLAVMFLSAAFVALASVRFRTPSLAVASLVLAGIAPLLTNAGAPNYVGLFSYLLVVIAGTVWISLITGQRDLVAAALVLIALFSLPHLLVELSQDRDVLILFIYAFSALFFMISTLALARQNYKDMRADIFIAVGNGFLLLSWIMVAVREDWRSLIIVAWMFAFAAGAYVIFRFSKKREPFYVYLGVCITMLAAATATELNGAALTIAYTVESGLIPVLIYFMVRDYGSAARTSILLVGPVLLSLQNIVSPSWANGPINEDFFVLLILGLILLGSGLFFHSRVREAPDKELAKLPTVFYIAASIYAYILLWLTLTAMLVNDDLAAMISLVVYTIVGISSYIYGGRSGRQIVRYYGALLSGFVVARLLLVDLWTMELTGRIITFFVIGALLVSTAFFTRKQSSPPVFGRTKE